MKITLYKILCSFILAGYSIVEMEVWWEATHSTVIYVIVYIEVNFGHTWNSCELCVFNLTYNTAAGEHIARHFEDEEFRRRSNVGLGRKGPMKTAL